MKSHSHAYGAIVAIFVLATIAGTASADNKRGNSSFGGKGGNQSFKLGNQPCGRPFPPMNPPKVTNCRPFFPTQPMVMRQPVVVRQPVFVAPVTVAPIAVQVEQLLQVPVGSTISLQGNNLGDSPGQVLLVVGKLTLAAQLNEWQPDHVHVTLPQIGIGEPTKAELAIIRPDGQLASSVKIELISAQAPTANLTPPTAALR